MKRCVKRPKNKGAVCESTDLVLENKLSKRTRFPNGRITPPLTDRTFVFE